MRRPSVGFSTGIILVERLLRNLLQAVMLLEVARSIIIRSEQNLAITAGKLLWDTNSIFLISVFSWTIYGTSVTVDKYLSTKVDQGCSKRLRAHSRQLQAMVSELLL
jgi:hypothetical protein